MVEIAIWLTTAPASPKSGLNIMYVGIAVRMSHSPYKWSPQLRIMKGTRTSGVRELMIRPRDPARRFPAIAFPICIESSGRTSRRAVWQGVLQGEEFHYRRLHQIRIRSDKCGSRTSMAAWAILSSVLMAEVPRRTFRSWIRSPLRFLGITISVSPIAVIPVIRVPIRRGISAYLVQNHPNDVSSQPIQY
jgi:hypothetical protein